MSPTTRHRPLDPLLRLLVCVLVVLGAAPATAAAAGLDDPGDQWMPSPAGASWTYRWSDTRYSPAPTVERYSVRGVDGPAFRLAWSTDVPGNTAGSVSSVGVIDYRRTDAGLVNLNFSSSPPPTRFPVLCAEAAGCANSLASTHYLAVWGARSPVVQEPLVEGATWKTVGGAGNDVRSDNRYLGTENVVVPAFPAGIEAAKIESTILQTGALGDPYGSGRRTVWWVRGVGPVKVAFLHAGGAVATSELTATNLSAIAPPPDAAYMPLALGKTMRFRLSNDRHLRRGVTQEFRVGAVGNNTARVDVRGRTGAYRVTGSHLLATRLSGLTSVATSVRRSGAAAFPRLGPSFVTPGNRKRFASALDLMTYGIGPVLPAFPTVGQVWKSDKASLDFRTFGVTGQTRIRGRRVISTRVGRVRALVVESTMRQNGFAFGSGTRTSYFARNLGLVKLVFRHRDGSESTVERLR